MKGLQNLNTAKSSMFQAGREISPRELAEIKEIVDLFPSLSLSELAKTICELTNWATPSGGFKIDACVKLLSKLESQGSIRLPAKRGYRRFKGGAAISLSSRTEPGAEICGTLSDLKPVWLEQVTNKEDMYLWNEYADRYHYLGYKKPIGCFMRYFIRFREGLLGCVLLAGAAKSIGGRDRWIRWSDLQRLNNLPFIVNNTRLLVFPWVRVKYLASHVLGLLARQIGQDWYERWGYRPVLMETFVDPDRF
ncbi:MAG: DUF4338 domain-containing protein, partial [bacterium]|nr:DUF4338 domain-containing protein [bacterium]